MAGTRLSRTNDTSFLGLAMFVAVVLLVVGVFGGIESCFNYNNDVYATDVYWNRTDYAKTVFKEWFEARYEVKVRPDDAVRLMDGELVHVLKGNKKNTQQEYVRVRFGYSGGFENFATVGARPNTDYVDKDNWDLVDVNSIDFQLMIVEEPAKPRIYAWN